VRAQAYSKEEIAAGAEEDPAVQERKKAEFMALGERMGSAYGYFQGVDGSRLGSGFLALLQSFMFALFQLLAQAALLLAQVLLRVVILSAINSMCHPHLCLGSNLMSQPTGDGDRIICVKPRRWEASECRHLHRTRRTSSAGFVSGSPCGVPPSV